jgi:hypothetical protein
MVPFLLLRPTSAVQLMNLYLLEHSVQVPSKSENYDTVLVRDSLLISLHRPQYHSMLS